MLSDEVLQRLTDETRRWYIKGLSVEEHDAAYHYGDLWIPALCRVVDAAGNGIEDAENDHVLAAGIVEYRFLNLDNKKRQLRFSFRCEMDTFLAFHEPRPTRTITLIPNLETATQLKMTPHDVPFEVLQDSRPAVWTDVNYRSLQLSFKARRHREQIMKKTVLELDLAGYSDIARTLEENLSADVVAAFNDQIQGFVDHGLAAVGTTRAETVHATTGDGAILLFDDPPTAHRFARIVFEVASAHNRGKTQPSAQRWFRMGAATGNISIRPRSNGANEIAGITIANAVRFEAAARVGQLVVDTVTYAALPPDLQREYGDEEQIKGKRDEKFTVRRTVMVADVQPDPHVPTVASVLELFDQLRPKDQLTRVMLLIAMPKVDRPAETLTITQRVNAILDWSVEMPDGLKKLDEVLRKLIKNQGG